MNIPPYASRTAIAAVLFFGINMCALAATYRVDTLEPVPGSSEFTTPTDINASGEVVGRSNFGEDFSRSVYWNSAGQLTNLTPGDVRFGNTAGISDAGTAVYSEYDRFYAWNAGTVTDLGAGFPSAVNGKGQIVGTFGGVFGIWTDGVVLPLPLPSPTTGSEAYDINNNAEVVGVASFTDLNRSRAVVWRNGTVQQIGTLPGDVSSVAYAINDLGQVVGHSVDVSGNRRAFIWENGVIRDLGFPVGTSSSAFGINNAGQVVGGFFIPGTTYNRAFVWQNGVLNDLSPELGAGSCAAYDINNAGQLTAACTKADFTFLRPFRLTPVALAGDLSVTLTATPLPAIVGLPLTYTTTVTNIGNAITTNATLTQNLPASGFTMASLTSSKGSCSGTSVVNCAFGDLASGESAVVTITVTPLFFDGVTAYYDSSVVAATSTPDVNPGNNTANIKFSVFANNAALSVHSINGQTSAIRGGNITYTWSLSNGGPLNARNVTLTDSLPSNLSLVSVKTTAGTCTGTVTVSCSLGDLRYGGSTTVTIVAKARASGTITNRATVTSTTPDSYTGDNSATVTTRVR